MGNIEWIITSLGIFTGITGAACATILPIIILGGIGYFLYKRNQQSGAARQIAQSWPSTTGTSAYVFCAIAAKRTKSFHVSRCRLSI